MKATVAAIFEALEIANGEAERGKDSAHSVGRLVIVRATLQIALKGCQLEIELPHGSEGILIPFLTKHTMTG